MKSRALEGVSILVVFLVMAAAISSCSSPTYLGKLPEVDSGKSAEICIISPERKSHYNRTRVVTLDAEPIIIIGYGNYTVFKVPLGEHAIGMECCPEYDVADNYEAGKRYFYVIESGPVNDALSRIIEPQAKTWLRRSNYMSVDNTIAQY